MCGIVGYVGDRPAAELLVRGLHRLEYRGYDSAGVGVVDGSLKIAKREGKVDELEELLASRPVEGSVGVGHTRWATHGEPSDRNAHPHRASDGSFALVHNGIVENYATLKKELSTKGYAFESETDTEVLVRLIEDVRAEAGLSLGEAVRQALSQVDGAYGIVVVSEESPRELIAARNGSPLLLGIGDGEHFVASDASALVEHTNQVVYLKDGEIAAVREEGYEVRTLENAPLAKEVHELEWELEEIEKGGYAHFMLKEIMEQPEAIEDAMRGRVSVEDARVVLGGLTDVMDRITEARRLIVCACGTSWHAGLVAEYLFEQLVRIPVEVDYASEFRYREPVLHEDDLMLAISQSGETADTLAAMRMAGEQGLTTLGVVNVVGSTIARETDAGVYLHAGPEIGVASTKAFTGQVTVLAMMALLLGRERGTIAEEEMDRYLRALAEVPDQIRQVLETSDELLELSRVYRYASNFLYMGRGYNFPVALEGALKLKEISYIHAEGYPAAEMKHGPIALIDPHMPVVVIAMKDRTYDKVVSNIEEVVARKGSVIAITDHEGEELDELCEHVIRVPSTEPFLMPLLTVIPLQLISYHIAVMRECDVDQPRNLAKSVTVE